MIKLKIVIIKFILKDENNNIISQTYSYYDEEKIKKKNEYKFILISTDTQIKKYSYI